MSKKRKRRKGGSNPASTGQIAETLGLDETVWDVGVSYNKGFLTNSRYRHVRVSHRPSGKTEERGFYANSKADARRPPRADIERTRETDDGLSGGRFRCLISNFQIGDGPRSEARLSRG